MAFLRLDLLHPGVSGNKWFKLQYNLEAAKQAGQDTILTFGGAYSNHMAATAVACKLHGFKAIGVIRGEEPSILNHTLQEARQNGMLLHFVPRDQYKRRTAPDFIASLQNKFGDVFVIPEGGNNEAGIRGAEAILNGGQWDVSAFTHICCAVGTGTTLAGLISAANVNQVVLGFPALKNIPSLEKTISQAAGAEAGHKQWKLVPGYDFGGYAKYTEELITFINRFYEDFNIPLDFVYTGKMAFGVMDMIKKCHLSENSRLLLIHTGGLQGNRSFPEGTFIF